MCATVSFMLFYSLIDFVGSGDVCSNLYYGFLQ